MRINNEITNMLVNINPEYRNYINNNNNTLTVKLKKALYGCLESAKHWYNTLSTYILSLGYKQNPYDHCVFNKHTDESKSTIVVYVDDLFITSTNKNTIQDIKKNYLLSSKK